MVCDIFWILLIFFNMFLMFNYLDDNIMYMCDNYLGWYLIICFMVDEIFINDCCY